ncbi:MAG: DUF2339 domain-containing protein, partial [Proteobacteria bacterium]|nr:DUF2339 domain-containing protein [Pseudomonadota bacterium]
MENNSEKGLKENLQSIATEFEAIKKQIGHLDSAIANVSKKLNHVIGGDFTSPKNSPSPSTPISDSIAKPQLDSFDGQVNPFGTKSVNWIDHHATRENGAQTPTNLAQGVQQNPFLTSTSATSSTVNADAASHPKIFYEPKPVPRHTESSFAQKWLLAVGIIITLFGIGYFIKYSFDQNWVGPTTRVAMAYVWGIVFLGIGEMARRKGLEQYGLYLMGGGIGVFYLATFSAFKLYELIPQMPAFLLLALITVLSGTLAIFYNQRALAILGTLGGFLSPFLVSTGNRDLGALFLYITVLNTGILWLASFKNWSLLIKLGFAFTWLICFGVMARYTESEFLVIFGFVNLFFTIFAVAPLLYYFNRTTEQLASSFSILIPNVVFGLGFSVTLLKLKYEMYYAGGVSVAYALLYLGLANHLNKVRSDGRVAVLLLIQKAIILFILTIPLILEGCWITTAWALQVCLLVWAGSKLKEKNAILTAIVLCVITDFHLLVFDWGYHFKFIQGNSLFWHLESYLEQIGPRWITAISVVTANLCLGYFLNRSPDIRLSEDAKEHRIFYGTAGIIAFLFLNLEISAAFYEYNPDARFAAISCLWTVFSFGILLLGLKNHDQMARRVGLAMFGVTILKVF